MPDSEHKLVAFNVDGLLSNLLSAEEHLVEQAKDGSINSTWCTKKHLTLALNHHAKELIEHSAVVDNELSREVAEFSKKLEVVRDSPSLPKVRELRNEFREIVSDPTLKKCGAVCDFDAKNLNTGSSYDGSTHTNSENSFLGKRGENMALVTDANGLLVLGGGNVLGIGASKVTKMFDKAGQAAFQRPSFYLNLGGGLALQLVAVMSRKHNMLTDLAAIVGSSLFVQEGVNTVMQLAQGTTTARAGAVAARRSADISVRPSDQLVTID